MMNSSKYLPNHINKTFRTVTPLGKTIKICFQIDVSIIYFIILRIGTGTSIMI